MGPCGIGSQWDDATCHQERTVEKTMHGVERAAAGLEAECQARLVDKAWAPIPFLRWQWLATFPQEHSGQFQLRGSGSLGQHRNLRDLTVVFSRDCQVSRKSCKHLELSNSNSNIYSQLL